MSYMELIYIDSEGHARKTGLGAAMETAEETWRTFRSYKSLDQGREGGFLLDYYNRKGDLADTVSLTPEAAARITGEPVKSDAEYREIDKQFWGDMRANISPIAHDAAIAAAKGEGK